MTTTYGTTIDGLRLRRVMGKDLWFPPSPEVAGIAVMTEEFGCPICRFNAVRSPEGSCTCDNADCQAKAPGSIPDHETWLRGPDSCVTAAKEHMREQGWIK